MESFDQAIGIEQAAVGVGRPGHLLLAVGVAVEQLELGVGPADEVLETFGHPPECVLRVRGDVGGVDDQCRFAHSAADALAEFLLAVNVLGGLGPKDLVLDRRE